MLSHTIRRAAAVFALALALVPVTGAVAGITVYEKDATKLEVGARVQIQYLQAEDADGDTPDDLFFRRLRPYIAGTVTEDWFGKFELDFGESLDTDDSQLKDAFVEYRGWESVKLTIGNSKTPFSREFITSSGGQQLIERTVVGDHNFGAPDRQLGIKADGRHAAGRLAWSASVGQERHDPNADRMDFDSPANDESDWNEGRLYAARVELHPLGPTPYDQADFNTDSWKFVVGVGSFVWDNDGDRNTLTDPNTGLTLDPEAVDLDEATGFELSGGVRGHGVSADIEFQKISGETVDSTFTGGLYEDGETDLDKMAVEGGYMFRNNHLELVAGWDSQDASNYETAMKRTYLGVNIYVNQHKAKFQGTWTMVDDFLGVGGDDRDLLQVQFQFGF